MDLPHYSGPEPIGTLHRAIDQARENRVPVAIPTDHGYLHVTPHELVTQFTMTRVPSGLQTIVIRQADEIVDDTPVPRPTIEVVYTR